MSNSRIQKIANIVSILGHPFLTSGIFTLFISFYLYDGWRAIISAAIIIGVLILPAFLWNYRKSRTGAYTNFDVSDRNQRKSMYWFFLPLYIAVILIMHFTEQSRSLVYGMIASLILFLTSWIANFFIKVSLHSSASFFLAISVMTIHRPSGIFFIFLSFIVAWSRVVLKRHSVSEVIGGGIIGIATGVGLYFILLNS
jgi:membrane-associated phospholipid phosphatase